MLLLQTGELGPQLTLFLWGHRLAGCKEAPRALRRRLPKSYRFFAPEAQAAPAP
jgi:hypothetical protein